MKIQVIAVVAHDEDGGIGKSGSIPWHIPGEMAWVAKLTKSKSGALSMNNALVMGRNTWESLPRKPLPDRINVVVTTQESYAAQGAEIFNDLKVAVTAMARKNLERCFIFGGEQIYREAFRLKLVDEVIATEIPGHFGCDTFFPIIPDYLNLCATEIEKMGEVTLKRNYYKRHKDG